MSRLYRISILAFPILVLTAIAGCSADPTVEEKIEAARDYIETSNYEPAQTICDRLRTQLYDNPVSANATTLAELSLLYMRLADADDRQDNIGLAYSCYEEAFRMDSASAAAYGRSAPTTDRSSRPFSGHGTSTRGAGSGGDSGSARPTITRRFGR